jgi:RHS repeat-associated protein
MKPEYLLSLRTTSNTSPSGGSAYSLNLRFPGQYFDTETGLHYNYFRDYEPGVGRYVESDPIGFRGVLLPIAMSKVRPSCVLIP